MVRIYHRKTEMGRLRMAVFWVGAIELMMEAASTSETWANFYQTTWRNNAEDSNLQNLT
jgi:hypothetical protein